MGTCNFKSERVFPTFHVQKVIMPLVHSSVELNQSTNQQNISSYVLSLKTEKSTRVYTDSASEQANKTKEANWLHNDSITLLVITSITATTNKTLLAEFLIGLVRGLRALRVICTHQI